MRRERGVREDRSVRNCSGRRVLFDRQSWERKGCACGVWTLVMTGRVGLLVMVRKVVELAVDSEVLKCSKSNNMMEYCIYSTSRSSRVQNNLHVNKDLCNFCRRIVKVGCNVIQNRSLQIICRLLQIVNSTYSGQNKYGQLHRCKMASNSLWQSYTTTQFLTKTFAIVEQLRFTYEEYGRNEVYSAE